MIVLTEAYRRFFKRFRGSGWGLGLFNKVHEIVWEGFLQPDFVEIDGMRLYLQKHDTAVSDSLRMQEDWESEETAIIKDRLKPEMTFFDVGANLGYYTVLASRLVGPRGKVWAFEPEPGNVSLLVRNIATNRCANVVVYPYAVAESLGYADLHQSSSEPAAHSIKVPPQGADIVRRIVTIALKDLMAPGCRPDLVKMDIEGAEFAALKGMGPMLDDRRLRTLVMECHPDILLAMGLRQEDLMSLLRGHGFETRLLADGKNLVATRA